MYYFDELAKKVPNMLICIVFDILARYLKLNSKCDGFWLINCETQSKNCRNIGDVDEVDSLSPSLSAKGCPL